MEVLGPRKQRMRVINKVIAEINFPFHRLQAIPRPFATMNAARAELSAEPCENTIENRNAGKTTCSAAIS
jgi:hypothetical protein